MAEFMEMERKLKVYDVDQHGWEHEAHGFEFNVAHVLKHLSRDIHRKNFFNSKTVREELAPDSVQYGLRLARWAGMKRELVIPVADSAKLADEFSGRLRVMSPRIGAYMLAMSWMGDYSHGIDHSSTRAETEFKRYDLATKSGQMLLWSAELSALEFGFDLERAFDYRLSDLRARFNIPEPEQA